MAWWHAVRDFLQLHDSWSSCLLGEGSLRNLEVRVQAAQLVVMEQGRAAVRQGPEIREEGESASPAILVEELATDESVNGGKGTWEVLKGVLSAAMAIVECNGLDGEWEALVFLVALLVPFLKKDRVVQEDDGVSVDDPEALDSLLGHSLAEPLHEELPGRVEGNAGILEDQSLEGLVNIIIQTRNIQLSEGTLQEHRPSSISHG